jgi:hypothetical protein
MRSPPSPPGRTSRRSSSAATRKDTSDWPSVSVAARELPEDNGGDTTVAPEPRNFDFEEHDGDTARSWTTSAQLAAFGYAVRSSTQKAFAGSRCALVSRLPGPRYGEAVGRFQQRIDAQAYRGKRVRLSGAVRAKVRAGGSARLLLQVETNIGPVNAMTAMRDHPIVEPGWRTYATEIDVPAKASTLVVGGALVGDGSACFDAFKLEIVGPPPAS